MPQRKLSVAFFFNLLLEFSSYPKRIGLLRPCGNFASVGVYDCLSYGETDAVPTGFGASGSIHTVKPIEHVMEALRIHRLLGLIANREDETSPLFFQRDGNGSVFGGILDRIVHENGYQSGKCFLVSAES